MVNIYELDILEWITDHIHATHRIYIQQIFNAFYIDIVLNDL